MRSETESSWPTMYARRFDLRLAPVLPPAPAPPSTPACLDDSAQVAGCVKNIAVVWYGVAAQGEHVTTVQVRRHWCDGVHC